MLRKSKIAVMLLILRQFFTSHAFTSTKESSLRWRLPSSKSTSLQQYDSPMNYGQRQNLLQYFTMQRPLLAPLQAIESRELRFYGSSVVLERGVMEDGVSSPTINTSSDNHNMLNFKTIGNEYAPDSHPANLMNDPLSNLLSLVNGKPKSRPSNKADQGGDGKKKKKKGPQIYLTDEEDQLFNLLTKVIDDSEITSTLRVAGGWVRDKLLATEEFNRKSNDIKAPVDGSVDRLTSKFKGPSSGRQGSKLIGVKDKSNVSPQSLVDANAVPVDIDIALDDMLGREFADHLNTWLTDHGGDKISVGVVLKNPEKSKHLETATMKVGKFWIDFVNLRAEEYTEDSRIPDLMRIGTAHEDALRRDLTINSLFYNINTGEVEDFTGKGFDDLRKGTVSTPLPPLTTLLDDPLRVLRSIRFAARLRFTMDSSLREAARTESVRKALAQKVARERVGSEVDLMLRSQDPVGAMRLILNLNLTSVVFPVPSLQSQEKGELVNLIFNEGLHLLTTTHDYLCDCKVSRPVWCEKARVSKTAVNGVDDLLLIHDDEARRRLWYASFLKPLRDYYKNLGQAETAKAGARQGKKASRSVIMKILVDELKRPLRDAEAIESVMKAADDLTELLNAGCAFTATTCLLNNVRIICNGDKTVSCYMDGRLIDSDTEDDPEFLQAMQYRLLVAKVLERAGPLWRAAMILSLSEQLAAIENDQLSYTIEGDVVSINSQ